MKELELSIENKAKTYDANYKTYTELINRLEDAKNAIKKQNYGIAMDVLCKPYPEFQITVFSELKENTENDDEKIRKALLKIIADIDGGFPFEKYGIQKKEARAWLEKQGENEDKDIETKLSHAHFEGEIEGRDKVLLNPEKYGLQKTAEKVEPKFHEGDWVFIEEVEGYKNGPFQIKTVDSFGYGFEEYHTIPFMYENLISKWTIKDAKNGDVLSWDDNKCIAIFKNIYDENSFNSYGFVGHCTDKFESRQSYHDIEGAHLATKEQCDLLLQKMHEAGYEIDTEKKELKKIEQKHVESDDTNAKRMFIKALERVEEQNNKGYKLTDCDKNSWWEDFKTYTSCTVEQNPTWSEEDEKIYRKCICAMRASACGFPEEEKFVEQVDNWLNSLRHQTTWKPSEEQMKALAYAVFDTQSHSYYDRLSSLEQQLKKLMEE